MAEIPGLAMAGDPRGYFGTAKTMFSVPDAEIQSLQLEALRARFEHLVHDIPAVSRRVIDTGVTAVEALDHAVPLLFPASVYKSYPVSWLESYDFARLTNWLGQLTV